MPRKRVSIKPGCGDEGRLWFRGTNDPAHNICVVHDADYDKGVSGYRELAKVDGKFVGNLWAHTAKHLGASLVLLAESIIYPPIVHTWGVVRLLTGYWDEDNENTPKDDS